MTAQIEVVHRLSLWQALKIRLAGRAYIDGYTHGAEDVLRAQVDEGEFEEVEDDEGYE